MHENSSEKEKHEQQSVFVVVVFAHGDGFLSFKKKLENNQFSPTTARTGLTTRTTIRLCDGLVGGII